MLFKYRIEGYQSDWVTEAPSKSAVKNQLTFNKGAFKSCATQAPVFKYIYPVHTGCSIKYFEIWISGGRFFFFNKKEEKLYVCDIKEVLNLASGTNTNLLLPNWLIDRALILLRRVQNMSIIDKG